MNREEEKRIQGAHCVGRRHLQATFGVTPTGMEEEKYAKSWVSRLQERGRNIEDIAVLGEERPARSSAPHRGFD